MMMVIKLVFNLREILHACKRNIFVTFRSVVESKGRIVYFNESRIISCNTVITLSCLSMNLCIMVII